MKVKESNRHHILFNNDSTFIDSERWPHATIQNGISTYSRRRYFVVTIHTIGAVWEAKVGFEIRSVLKAQISLGIRQGGRFVDELFCEHAWLTIVSIVLTAIDYILRSLVEHSLLPSSRLGDYKGRLPWPQLNPTTKPVFPKGCKSLLELW